MSQDSRRLILDRIYKGLGKNDSHMTSESNKDFSDITNSNPFLKEKSGHRSDELIEQFIGEVEKVNGICHRLDTPEDIELKLLDIVYSYDLGKYAIADTELMNNTGIRSMLESRGLIRLDSNNKAELAEADVGITGVDYAISDSGTLVIFSDHYNSRSISLLPPVHIAILEERLILKDIHHLFYILRENHRDITDISSCITFITGPSRTADIELNLTLGVHGPGKLIVFLIR